MWPMTPHLFIFRLVYCLNTVDISYSASSAIIQSLTHNTFTVLHWCDTGQTSMKSVEATTDNEFLVQIGSSTDGTSLEFFKSSVNNQDKYILVNTERTTLLHSNGLQKNSLRPTTMSALHRWTKNHCIIPSYLKMETICIIFQTKQSFTFTNIW